VVIQREATFQRSSETKSSEGLSTPSELWGE
jgi:hypothetical protein